MPTFSTLNLLLDRNSMQNLGKKSSTNQSLNLAAVTISVGVP